MGGCGFHYTYNWYPNPFQCCGKLVKKKSETKGTTNILDFELFKLSTNDIPWRFCQTEG